MKKRNSLSGVIIGLAINLMILPVVGIWTYSTIASAVRREEIKLESNIEYLSNTSEEAKAESRLENAQDILRDYRNYLNNEK